jgi:hypothetical protein
MEVDQDPERAQRNYEPAGPKPIKKLSKDVINQIAAAEVSIFHKTGLVNETASAYLEIGNLTTNHSDREPVDLTSDHPSPSQRHQRAHRELSRRRIHLHQDHAQRRRAEAYSDFR